MNVCSKSLVSRGKYNVHKVLWNLRISDMKVLDII